MSYRNPRFCYEHAALDAGSGSLSVGGGGVLDGTTSIERLRDLRAKAVARIAQNGSGQSHVELDRGAAAATRRNVNRLLIPAGHTLHTQRARVRLTDSPDLATWTKIAFADGATGGVHAQPHVVDVELAETGLRGLRAASFDTPASVDVELGELWWTRTVQPTTGIVPRWQQDREPNVLRSVTTGGESFSLERGPARRVYDLEHKHISGADLALYEALVRSVGVSGRPFWYEHPDSGDAAIVQQAFNDQALWSVTNGSASDMAGSGWGGGNAVAMSSAAAGAVTARYTWPAELDFRNHFASIDVRIPTTSAWLTLVTDLRVFLYSRQVDLGSELQWAGWNIGAYILDMTSPLDTWWRIYLDLDAPDAVSGSTGQMLDLERVDRIALLHDATAGSQVAQWDNFQVYDREKQPRLVELLSLDKRMDSKNKDSAEGPTYTIRMQMIEVLT